MPGPLSAIVAELEALGGRALALLPSPVQRALSGRPPRVIDGHVLDAGVQLILRMLALRGESAIHLAGRSVDEERARTRRNVRSSVGRMRTEVGAVADRVVVGADGPLAARHYAPPAADGAPLVVYLHGGGWTICDLDTHDEPCRMLCRHAGVHVLSVDYRLAPEHPFPAPVDDAIAATRWALAHAAELGADPARVAVGGDSAGGNLAAVVAGELARSGEPGPVLQLLIYPATDLTDHKTRSDELFGEGFYLESGSRAWFEGHYLPDAADRSDPRASPLLASGHAGLPPAVIATAAFDPLRDEGEAYADALRAAGSRVVVHRFEGLIHGFINLTTVNRRSRDAMIAIAELTRSELART